MTTDADRLAVVRMASAALNEALCMSGEPDKLAAAVAQWRQAWVVVDGRPLAVGALQLGPQRVEARAYERRQR